MLPDLSYRPCKKCPTDATGSLGDTVLAPEATEASRLGTVSDLARPGEGVFYCLLHYICTTAEV